MKRIPASLLVAYASIAMAPRLASAQPARFAVTEELRIGSADPGREGLSRVPAMAVASDGRMFIVQPLSHAVWVFDINGRRLPDIGRRGAGPGEFEAPLDIGWRGDSLWVLDLARVKFTLFDSGFRPRGTVQVGPGHYPSGLLADGSVLSYERPADMEIGTGRVTSSAYRRSSRDGRTTGTLARFSWAHYGMYIHRPGEDLPNTYRLQPFSDTPLFDVSSRGQAMVMVDRPASAARRGEFTVRRFDASGRLMWASRVGYTPRALSDRTVDDSVAARAAIIASIPEFRATQAIAERWIRQALYRPRNRPPVTAVVAGRDGTTWLRRESVERGMVDWLVLGEWGEKIGETRVPAALQIMEADRSHVWGVVMDADNVPFVVRYRIRANARRSFVRTRS